jgi:hypothetical protein
MGAGRMEGRNRTGGAGRQASGPHPASLARPPSSPRAGGASAGRRHAGSCRRTGSPGSGSGNETIRISPDGEVSIRLPAPLAYLANAPHGRYVLTGRVVFAHRGQEGADRVTANRAVAHRIHHDVDRGRWYVTASWQIPVTRTIPLATALADGVVGVDMNADHLAAWTPTATCAVSRAASPTTSPAPPTTATPRSATP